MAKILDDVIEAICPLDTKLNRDRVELYKGIEEDYGFMMVDNPAMDYILKECGII